MKYLRSAMSALFGGALSLFLYGHAGAQSLATSARQLPKGSLKLVGYYQGIQSQELEFSVNGALGCVSPNGVAFSCGAGGDIDTELNGSQIAGKALWQPTDIFQYYLGAAGGKVAFNTPAGQFKSDTPAMSYTAGVKAVVYPDTVVTPAIAVDVSVTHSRLDYNRFYEGVNRREFVINQRLHLMQYQLALQSSKMFTIKDDCKLEPYGGVSIGRTDADLLDRQTGSHAGGQKNYVLPFAGLRIPVGSAGVFGEMSFVNGRQWAAGMDIRF